ncbi:hypothetical protein BKA67DRAFT_537756 [Truncatella angustata]|uniref:Uncharacterized protein n=1 Tax=Truncatella angustata TaxID=152316 RepID=A0A9P8UGW9_9PEZI|nr:uncharacterized protein BKA67DRAFT_537756 [Truncatella angustata]KAH6651905.1 hypothetical protein BKA67DRAFT_537756 [Truncatella angustata]
MSDSNGIQAPSPGGHTSQAPAEIVTQNATPELQTQFPLSQRQQVVGLLKIITTKVKEDKLKVKEGKLKAKEDQLKAREKESILKAKEDKLKTKEDKSKVKESRLKVQG